MGNPAIWRMSRRSSSVSIKHGDTNNPNKSANWWLSMYLIQNVCHLRWMSRLQSDLCDILSYLHKHFKKIRNTWVTKLRNRIKQLYENWKQQRYPYISETNSFTSHTFHFLARMDETLIRMQARAMFLVNIEPFPPVLSLPVRQRPLFLRATMSACLYSRTCLFSLRKACRSAPDV